MVDGVVGGALLQETMTGSRRDDGGGGDPVAVDAVEAAAASVQADDAADNNDVSTTVNSNSNKKRPRDDEDAVVGTSPAAGGNDTMRMSDDKNNDPPSSYAPRETKRPKQHQEEDRSHSSTVETTTANKDDPVAVADSVVVNKEAGHIIAPPQDTTLTMGPPAPPRPTAAPATTTAPQQATASPPAAAAAAKAPPGPTNTPTTTTASAPRPASPTVAVAQSAAPAVPRPPPPPYQPPAYPYYPPPAPPPPPYAYPGAPPPYPYAPAPPPYHLYPPPPPPPPPPPTPYYWPPPSYPSPPQRQPPPSQSHTVLPGIPNETYIRSLADELTVPSKEKGHAQQPEEDERQQKKRASSTTMYDRLVDAVEAGRALDRLETEPKREKDDDAYLAEQATAATAALATAAFAAAAKEEAKGKVQQPANEYSDIRKARAAAKLRIQEEVAAVDAARAAANTKIRLESPFSKGELIMYPSKCREVLNIRYMDQATGTEHLVWKPGGNVRRPGEGSHMLSSDHWRYVRDLEHHLAILSNRDPELAAAMLSGLMKRPTMGAVHGYFVPELESTDERFITCRRDKEIVDNISAFIRHHQTAGQRSKDPQNALDAVVTACTFDANLQAQRDEAMKTMDNNNTALSSHARARSEGQPQPQHREGVDDSGEPRVDGNRNDTVVRGNIHMGDQGDHRTDAAENIAGGDQGDHVEVLQQEFEGVPTHADKKSRSKMINMVTQRLGVARRATDEFYKYGLDMIRTGQHFQPKERKTRQDRCRDDAVLAVYEFCHSDGASCVDTSIPPSRNTVKVDDVKANEPMRHPIRVWLEPKADQRYATFLQSPAFAQFKEKHPDKGIGKTVFREGICKCLRDDFRNRPGTTEDGGPQRSSRTTTAQAGQDQQEQEYVIDEMGDVYFV